MAQFFQSVGDVLSTLGSSFCVPGNAIYYCIIYGM